MDRSLSPHSADWTLSFFAFPWGLRNCGKLTKAWPRSLNFDPWGPIPSTTSYDRGGTPALRSRAIPADGTAVFTEAGQEPRGLQSRAIGVAPYTGARTPVMSRKGRGPESLWSRTGPSWSCSCSGPTFAWAPLAPPARASCPTSSRQHALPRPTARPRGREGLLGVSPSPARVLQDG